VEGVGALSLAVGAPWSLVPLPASLLADKLAVGACEREEHAAAIRHDAAEPDTPTYPIAILAQAPRIAIIRESWRFRPLTATGAPSDTLPN
jgi:hypothetical protein